MAQADSEYRQKSFPQLLEELLKCTDKDFLLWLHEHRTSISLEFLQHLKDNFITSTFILRDPQKAEQITRYILQISTTLPNEPLALALGQWMRGIWASYNHTTTAAILYQSALPAYQVLNDKLSVAKLYSNLVGVLANLNQNDQAEYYYTHARSVFLEYVDKYP